VRSRAEGWTRQPRRHLVAGVVLGLLLATDALALDAKTSIAHCVHDRWDVPRAGRLAS
jgi:hypothetical protein